MLLNNTYILGCLGYAYLYGYPYGRPGYAGFWSVRVVPHNGDFVEIPESLE